MDDPISAAVLKEMVALRNFIAEDAEFNQRVIDESRDPQDDRWNPRRELIEAQKSYIQFIDGRINLLCQKPE